MDVDLEHIVRGQHDHRPAKLSQLRADLGTGREFVAASEDLGAVLVVALQGYLGQRCRVGHIVFHRSLGWQNRVSLDQPDDPLQHENKRLGACVHYTGFFQHGQQVGRVLEGVFSVVQDP